LTTSRAPLYADVFVVGRIQASGFPVEAVGEPSEYQDALFNRNGRSCLELYSRLSGNGPSPVRRNLDALEERLRANGISNVIETNVICPSAPASHELAVVEQADTGTEIFTFLLEAIQPSVLIAHGAGTVKQLEPVLETSLAQPRTEPGPAPATTVKRPGAPPLVVISIPSLTPPAWNRWRSWAGEHLDEVAARVARVVARGR
jgi:hypothetical protein